MFVSQKVFTSFQFYSNYQDFFYRNISSRLQYRYNIFESDSLYHDAHHLVLADTQPAFMWE